MKETRKVVVLVGPSNSGKSTYAKEFVKNYPNFIRLNRDCMRHMLHDTEQMDKRGESLILDILDSAATEALIQGYDLLLDNCHCKLSAIKEIVNSYSEIADIDFVVFPEYTVDELVVRAEERSKIDGYLPTPRERLEVMVTNFRELKKVYDFAPIKKVET